VLPRAGVLEDSAPSPRPGMTRVSGAAASVLLAGEAEGTVGRRARRCSDRSGSCCDPNGALLHLPPGRGPGGPKYVGAVSFPHAPPALGLGRGRAEGTRQAGEPGSARAHAGDGARSDEAGSRRRRCRGGWRARLHEGAGRSPRRWCESRRGLPHQGAHRAGLPRPPPRRRRARREPPLTAPTELAGGEDAPTGRFQARSEPHLPLRTGRQNRRSVRRARRRHMGGRWRSGSCEVAGLQEALRGLPGPQLPREGQAVPSDGRRAAGDRHSGPGPVRPSRARLGGNRRVRQGDAIACFPRSTQRARSRPGHGTVSKRSAAGPWGEGGHVEAGGAAARAR
jgi:hypothetical protein